MRKQTNKRSTYKRRGGVNSPSARKTASHRMTAKGLWAEQKEKIIANGKRFRNDLYRDAPLTEEQESLSEHEERSILDSLKFPSGFSSWSTLISVYAAIRASKK
jgi:hypothetical protein